MQNTDMNSQLRQVANIAERRGITTRYTPVNDIPHAARFKLIEALTTRVWQLAHIVGVDPGPLPTLLQHEAHLFDRADMLETLSKLNLDLTIAYTSLGLGDVAIAGLEEAIKHFGDSSYVPDYKTVLEDYEPDPVE